MEKKIAVATIGRETYHTELVAREHVLVADEPVEDGGKDEGPRPGDLLRMSLASCTAITLRMYANRKKYDIEKIVVSVSSLQEGGKTVFDTHVELHGNLDPEQQERMQQIATKCPVHKILTNPININTSTSLVPNS